MDVSLGHSVYTFGAAKEILGLILSGVYLQCNSVVGNIPRQSVVTALSHVRIRHSCLKCYIPSTAALLILLLQHLVETFPEGFRNGIFAIAASLWLTAIYRLVDNRALVFDNNVMHSLPRSSFA